MANPHFPLVGLDSTHTPNATILTQFPWQIVDVFATTRSDMECGKSYTYSYNATPIKRFKIVLEAIEQSELAIVEAFFDSMAGRMGIFDLYDAQANLLAANCRFDQDSMVVKYPEPGKYSTEFMIIRPMPI